MMVEDMLFNPILAAKVIFRVRLPPHEELRILWMWTSYYTNDDSGFSTGKSWTYALVAAMRCVLMTERTCGILSKTFAQGKLIFANLDRWYNTSPIFRSTVSHAGGKPRLLHGNEAWTALFRGGSEIRVLPPNFMHDAERLRSERWNDAFLDEWVTYGNFQALNTTIIGRVTKTNNFKNCDVRRNHVHLASTPKFKHHPAYKMVRRVDRHIARGNHNYGHFTCNWRHVPATEQWDFLLNEDIIYHMQTTLPKGFVRTEIDGIWEEDSATWYNSKAVSQCRLSSAILTLHRTHPDDIYIAAFDTAAGGGDNSARSGDDFALSVWRMRAPDYLPIHCLTTRYNKISDIQMSGLIHKYDRIFNFALVVGDPGGGGLFVKDKLRNDKQLIDNNQTEATPIVTVTDPSGVLGNPKLVMFDRSDYYVKLMWGKMASDSVIVNKLHTEFRGAIENQNVALSGTWDGWQKNEAMWDVAGKREWLNQHAHLSEQDKIKAEMDLAVDQLILVDYAHNRDGTPKIDSFGMYKFESKEKKDSAYTLVYGYFGCLLYRWMMKEGITSDSSDDNEDVAVEMEPI